MDWFSEKIAVWRTNDTARGITPWVIGLLALYVLASQVTYLRTNMERTVTGLEPGTMYLRQKRAGFCIGDVVRALSAERRESFYAPVAAEAGAEFSLTESGYSLNGQDEVLGADWQMVVREKMGDTATLIVPEDHVFFINSQFDPDVSFNNWAFESVPRRLVRDRVSHILLAHDWSRIGEPVGSTSPDCVR